VQGKSIVPVRGRDAKYRPSPIRPTDSARAASACEASPAPQSPATIRRPPDGTASPLARAAGSPGLEHVVDMNERFGPSAACRYRWSQKIAAGVPCDQAQSSLAAWEARTGQAQARRVGVGGGLSRDR